MLVITRKVGQSIRIGDNIEVIVIQRQGNQIRLGIKAPKEIEILRDDAKIKEKLPVDLIQIQQEQGGKR